MKIVISILAICLFSSIVFSQKQKVKKVKKNPLIFATINEEKPAVYIEFEKTLSYTFEMNGETKSYNVVWLRLYNNMKGSISFFTYDESVSPTGKKGIHYLVEKLFSISEPSSRDNSNIPIGFPPYDDVDIAELKSGESYYFGIPQFHMIKDTKIAIEFFYPWEVGREFEVKYKPEHFVYFLEGYIPKEMKKKLQGEK